MNEINKYLSKEKINEAIDAFQKAVNSRHSVMLSVIISSIILLLLSVLVCFKSTVTFGILLFFCLSPIFIISVGIFSSGNTLKRIFNSINTIFQTVLNISVAFYNDRKSQNNNLADIMIYSFENILLPVLKTTVKKSARSRIIIYLIELVIKIGSKKITALFPKQNINGTTSDKNQLNFSALNETSATAAKAMNSIVVISKVLGILFVIVGILLTAILFTVRAFVVF